MTEQRDELKKEIDDIRNTVHRLEATKQNKVPLAIIVSVTIWCAGITVSSAWWAATMTEGFQNLAEKVELAAQDRYFARDAAADFALRDQIADYIENRVQTNEEHLLQLEQELDKLRDEVRNDK